MKKPIFKKWWFWLIVVFIIGGIGNIIDKKDNTTTATTTVNVEKYKPEEVGEFGLMYRTKTNKETDGSYPIINISKITKNDDLIIVAIGAPDLARLNYAMDNFLYVALKDEGGKNIKVKRIILEPVQDGEIEANLNVFSDNTEKAKWIEIGPYKLKDNQKLIFEIKES